MHDFLKGEHGRSEADFPSGYMVASSAQGSFVALSIAVLERRKGWDSEEKKVLSGGHLFISVGGNMSRGSLEYECWNQSDKAGQLISKSLLQFSC